ncbi:MAG: hypothetical protein DHS20C14_00130 [Phycisphaeraceae bacterium]|nr:MAG: hypothetical protein DHS20C14_00130 [Phycisphaeraceae bacterium]
MNTQTTTTRAIVALTLAGCTATATAQSFQQNSYSVSHTFDLQPAGDVVSVWFSEFRHAWVQSTQGSDWDSVPAQSHPEFDGFGTDSFGSPTCFNSGLAGSAVPCDWQSSQISNAGASGSACTLVDFPPSFAIACNSLTVAPWSATPPYHIQGSFGSSGGVQAGVQGRGAAFTYAYSSCGISVRGGTQLASGFIQWGTSFYSDAVGGGVGASALADPVHFIATNLNTGVTVDAVLLDIDLDFDDTGLIDWNPAGLTVDTAEMDLVVDIPPTHVAPGQEGRIEFRVENGAVTVANDSGIFDGLLPPLGTAVPFDIPLPSNFNLDYDLALNPADPWDVEAILSGGGDTGASLELLGCPADLDGNGVLNVDDVDAFVSLFLEGNLAADLTGDEVLNVDDIDAFVESFLSGCVGPDGGDDYPYPFPD